MHIDDIKLTEKIGSVPKSSCRFIQFDLIRKYVSGSSRQKKRLPEKPGAAFFLYFNVQTRQPAINAFAVAPGAAPPFGTRTIRIASILHSHPVVPAGALFIAQSSHPLF